MALFRRRQDVLPSVEYSQEATFYSSEQCFTSYCTVACSGAFTSFDRYEKLSGDKARKAENKALLLLQNTLGVEQCDIYRKTHRVILKPSRWDWIVGDMFGSFHENYPYSGKPDVVRIDNSKKLHYTSFCVAQRDREPTPYTDKVLSFVWNLVNDELGFFKMINRIREGTFDKPLECALWGGE